jgi:hypothetical protein
MACESFIKPNQTIAQRAREIDEALDTLEQRLQNNSVKVVIDKRTGALTFAGWNSADRRDITDACAYRVMVSRNSVALRQAVARAEAIQGVKVNQRAIATGMHSHDGGKTWDKGH